MKARRSARVLVIYTGGTIGCLYTEPGNPASPLAPGTASQIKDSIRRHLPQLGRGLNITWDVELPTPKFKPVDSSNVGPWHWKQMDGCIFRNYAKYDGFVVLHGTDTMAYSASMLSFMLKNLAKPVVFTGSQLPLVDERTDARTNLANALAVAGGYKDDHAIPIVPEVLIVF